MNDVKPKHMPVAEFRKKGYIQEINRRLLHPLGLALEVAVEEDGLERLSGVWDYRDDPEGICYGGSLTAEQGERAAAIDAEWEARRPAREAALGYMIEPA